MSKAEDIKQIPITVGFGNEVDSIIGYAVFNKSNKTTKHILSNIDKYVFEVGYTKDLDKTTTLIEISAVFRTPGTS